MTIAANSQCYLKWGTYPHSPGECVVVISRRGIDAGGGRLIGFDEEWSVVGSLYSASIDTLQTAIAALEAAYATAATSIGLYYTGGIASPHIRLASETSDGLKVTVPPSYPNGARSELFTRRAYSLAVSCRVPDLTTLILSYGQRIRTEGTGGPDWGYRQTQDGPYPQRKTPSTPITVIQEGHAVGSGVYVAAASPLWPTYEHGPSRGVEYEIPSLYSNERVTTWHYVFLSTSRPYGAP